MKKITVHASTEYDILIEKGILSTCGNIIKEKISAQKIAVITDDTVDRLYGKVVGKSIREAGFDVVKFVFPHGETSKCADTLVNIYDFLCKNSITRTDCLVALGGGVV